MDKSALRLLAIAAVCLVFTGLSAPAAAQTVCSGNVSLDGGEYIFQSNEWNSTLPQCATIEGIGFALTTANFDQSALGSFSPATYPSVYRGCHWGDCTSSNPFPIEMSKLSSATSSVTITQPGGFANDSAYDIWFNQTSTTSGQPNGTEIMIWINHQGGVGPAGSLTGTVTIDGASYQVYTGRMPSWNIASYVANPGVGSVTNLNLIPFFKDAISRGMLESSWWLIDVEYGFEVWNGGHGLSATNFSVSASAGSGTCPPTAIIPAINVGGVWKQETSAAVTSTAAKVDLGPQPLTGTWSWTGPDGFTSTTRELDGIPLFAGSNAYKATYTNSCGSKSTQAFTISAPGSTTLIANGTYVVTAVNSGSALEDPNFSRTDGLDMQIFTVNDGASQQWTVNNVGSNIITLTNVSSGQLLDVAGASKSSGALVDQWPANGQTNQQWNVISLGGGDFKLTSVNSGLALSVVGGGTANGTGLDQLAYGGRGSQQWKFTAF
jgi:Glycosyl hydrolase family 12/Ricin-type beta-trefoil lectin domain-like